MKVLLLGAGGMLARAVESASPPAVQLRALSQADLDICNAERVIAALADEHPDWVINCAGWTQVDDAEDHEREATQVNGDAVGSLGEAARRVGARVLHVSTEYVFDGSGSARPYREDDVPNPRGAYGRSKLAGEQRLLVVGGGWLVVRTQWLYGGGPSFVRTMWNRAKSGQASRVVDDQWGAPTHVAELAAVIWRLVIEGRGGGDVARCRRWVHQLVRGGAGGICGGLVLTRPW